MAHTYATQKTLMLTNRSARHVDKSQSERERVSGRTIGQIRQLQTKSMRFALVESAVDFSKTFHICTIGSTHQHTHTHTCLYSIRI